MTEKINTAVQKRADLWNRMKNYLDTAKREGETLTAEALEEYEKMENDMSALDREISMLQRQQDISNRLNAPASNPILPKPEMPENEKTGRASVVYKNSFWQAMRNKDIPYEVTNALQIGTDSEGGYLVPDDFEHTLVDGLLEENIMRGIARTIQTSSGDRKIPVVSGHGSASWTDEEALITESDDSLGQVTLGAYKLATAVKVSEELLNDSIFSIDTYLANEFARRIGTKEEEAFLIGDGSNKPTGVFNAMGGGQVGITAASAAAITFDEIFDLFYSLKAAYRKNAVWIMNDSTVKAIRKLKDSNGQYMWQPSLSAGTPDTLLNRPILTSSYVPEINAGKMPVAFGDFSYYWIADRQGRMFKRLNELYAANGQVGFIASERVDGKLILPEAVKILKMKAS